MKKVIFFLLLFTTGLLQAQTAADNIESGARIYNKMRDYEDKLAPDNVKSSDVDSLNTYRDAGMKYFEEARKDATADQLEVVRYFSANFNYEIGFIDGMLGRNADAYRELSKIKEDYDYFSNSSHFPLNYRYDSQTYSVRYDNFSPTLAEYYTGMSEITANLGKTEESMDWSRKAIGFESTTDWYRYIAINKLLESKKKLDQWDKEMLDYSLQQIVILSKLDTSYQRTIRENNYPTALLGVNNIKTTLGKNPSLASGEYYRGTAAPLLAGMRRMQDDAVDFYRAALQGGYADYNRDYLFSAAQFCINEESNSTALLALDLLFEKNASSLSCADWDNLSYLYGKAGSFSRKQECAGKADDCRKQERKAQKRDENGSFGFGAYVGIYPLPMLTRYNRYRDYGGVVGFVFGKVGIEASYKKINRNLVITDDLTYKGIHQDQKYYWSGYKAHLAVNIFNKNEEGFYMGPLFEIVNRTFEPIWSNVTTTNSNYTVPDKRFAPSEKSYNLYFNYGTMISQKAFFMNCFFGIGLSYYKFDGGGSEYQNDGYLLSDPLLSNRKPTRFGPAIRAGITIGLGTIKK